MFTGFHPQRTTNASQARRLLLLAMLAAGLSGAAGAQAADEPKPAGERPIEPTPPRAASDASGVRKTAAEKDVASKPYGSGYEARGLDAAKGGAGLDAAKGGSGAAASAASSASAAAAARDERIWPTRAGSRSPAGAQRGGGVGRGGRR